MSSVRCVVCVGFRGVLGLATGLALLPVMNNAAGAHGYHRYYYRHAARAYAEAYAPPAASIVVDGNTGEVLHSSNADGSRHPASLTKIMTLYLLFERLDAGKIRLDSQLRVSEHAAEQAPTKLGLRPGQTIAVEDAIKAVVTKSANDAAVAIAENLGGGEEDQFAELMTQKGHALGMSHTTYVNASGLPDDAQVTTARDQALLGRAIQERFPHYYKYFSTEEFVYHGSAMRNHNHLLGVVGGVDGIKTGYTRASGFNLVTSVHRDGRYIVAVVLGGRSAGERDAHMRELIGAHIKEASVQRTAPGTEKLASRGASASRNELASRSEIEVSTAAKVLQRSRPDATVSNAAAEARASLGSSEPIHPVLVRTITYRTAPPQTPPLAPMPVLVPTSASSSQGAVTSANRRIAATETAQDSIVVASTEPPVVATAAKSESPKVELAREEHVATPPSTSPHARGGWLIQVGAYEEESEAKEHLNAAQLKIPGILASADPFTERVQKGEKTYYRARFVGLDKPAAEAACKLLKRSEVECMAVKN
jgi:D-alanyl-D-alanine carboxypeptidase